MANISPIRIAVNFLVFFIVATAILLAALMLTPLGRYILFALYADAKYAATDPIYRADYKKMGQLKKEYKLALQANEQIRAANFAYEIAEILTRRKKYTVARGIIESNVFVYNLPDDIRAKANKLYEDILKGQRRTHHTDWADMSRSRHGVLAREYRQLAKNAKKIDEAVEHYKAAYEIALSNSFDAVLSANDLIELFSAKKQYKDAAAIVDDMLTYRTLKEEARYKLIEQKKALLALSKNSVIADGQYGITLKRISEYKSKLPHYTDVYKANERVGLEKTVLELLATAPRTGFAEILRMLLIALYEREERYLDAADHVTWLMENSRDIRDVKAYQYEVYRLKKKAGIDLPSSAEPDWDPFKDVYVSGL